jgi:anaerobic selenocysteine-containing dehydrogenase
VSNPGDRPADAQRETLDRPLRVAGLIATRAGDADRGPMVLMHPTDAKTRLLADGELAWIHGPRRHELATVRIDESGRLGDVVLRDVIGAAPSEIIRVVRPDMDKRGRRPPSTGPR